MGKKIGKLVCLSCLFLLLVCCGRSGETPESEAGVIAAENGYAEGHAGDTMRTAWFDFRVNGARLCDSYADTITPRKDGEALLVVNVTMESRAEEKIPMFDIDFQAQWNSEGEDDYRYPVTLENPEYEGADMFPGEYSLEAGESRTGDLVFSVPAGMPEYSLSFLEYYDGEEEGDVFFVYFEAE